MSIAKLQWRMERERERAIDRYERRKEREAREWEPKRAAALRLIRQMDDFINGRVFLVNA